MFLSIITRMPSWTFWSSTFTRPSTHLLPTASSSPPFTSASLSPLTPPIRASIIRRSATMSVDFAHARCFASYLSHREYVGRVIKCARMRCASQRRSGTVQNGMWGKYGAGIPQFSPSKAILWELLILSSIFSFFSCPCLFFTHIFLGAFLHCVLVTSSAVFARSTPAFPVAPLPAFSLHIFFFPFRHK